MREIKRESFEELVKKAKFYPKSKRNQIFLTSSDRNDRHYTLMPLTLDRIEKLRKKTKNRSAIVQYAIMLLTGILECIGEEDMRILAMVERVITKIENSDLNAVSKSNIIADLKQIIQLIESQGVRK